MFNILNKVKEAQEKMKTVQAQLVHLQATSESGAGLVKVTINGLRQLVKVEIDQSIMNDKEMVQDLTVAAVNKAIEIIDKMIKEEMARSMEGMIPNIPGLDLSSFLK